MAAGGSRNGVLIAVVLIGCGATPPPASPPPTTPATATALPIPETTATPAITASNCADPLEDIARRAPDATALSTTLDLDGDGVSDQAFRGFCTMMGGNCDVFLYASNAGCPRFVGKVIVTRITSGPSCAEPPARLQPCKLSASRMMIHGEVYEYFYELHDGSYREAGVGTKGPSPPW